MVRKTRRHGSHKKSKGIYSIPELRRSFEHIESYINGKIAKKESKEKLVKDLRKEWSKVFFKDLDKKSADSFVSDRLSKKQTRRTLKGGAALAGAPLDSTLRQGIYLAPGQIPDIRGHLPLSDGSKSSFGSFIPYVDKGFWNPEPGRSYDPLVGQIRFPTSVPAGMGSNLFKGGRRQIREIRQTRKNNRRGGGLIQNMGTVISQAFTHPASSSVPPSILKDTQDIWYGKNVGPSPDQVERLPLYKIGSVYPKPVYITNN
jgi:hypothetical protein